MHDGITATPFIIGNKIIVVKDVPAEICSDCGESYMKSSVVDRIENLLDRIEDLDSEMSVVHYKIDGIVKSRKCPYFVIPTKVGIQSFQCVAKPLDSRFHGNDDFLRGHQDCVNKYITMLNYTKDGEI